MKTDTRIGFIITYFYNSPQSLEILKKNIKILGAENYYLILASHSPVDLEIQQLCDFYFFQSKNVVDTRKYSHGVAESNLMEIALKHLIDQNINWTYKATYDIEINDVNEFLRWRVDGYNFVSCNWGSNIICTNSFFSKVDFLLDNITFPRTINQMFSNNSVLENCWENDIRSKNLVSQTYAFANKQEFYGTNKIDILYYDYTKIDFWFQPEESKFFIKSSLTQRVHLRIFDYYTDLCIYLNRDFELIDGIIFWVTPPFANNMFKAKNGFYLEVYLENETIVKNFAVNDFDLKHTLSKRFKKIKNTEVKFNEFSDFDNLGIYPSLFGKIDEIKSFVDIGANCGLASISFIERGIKTYLVEADPNNIETIKLLWSNNSKIQVVDKAITKEDGKVDFWISPGIGSVASSLFEVDTDNNNLDRTKIEVDSISPNTLFENFIQEDLIDLMKVDIEGAEYDFFESISDSNLKRVKRLVVEYHQNENYKAMQIVQKLVRNNFKFKLQKWSSVCGDYIIENKMGVIYAEQIL